MSDGPSIPPLAYSYIRMSTHLQLKGDSRRRQLQRARKYADEHGLHLATDRELEDIGISAFKGANARKGKLAQFLEAIEEGKVPRGSYLIVESLDRLSRQMVVDAQLLFLRLLRSGINIVTLIDRHVYRGENPNIGDLISSIVSLSRAYEESATKSDRISEAWKKKRNQAAEKIVTSNAPAWLKVGPDRKSFEILPERAAIVRSIFEECAAGLGVYLITKRLNENGVSSFGKPRKGRKPRGWYESYVSRLISNRAVLGEFTSHSLASDGGRRAEGFPIHNYFPPIISEDLFYRAAAARSARRENGSGPKGKRFNNLFSGLLHCAYCGSKVRFENKGPAPKGATFLVCEEARRGLESHRTRWRYDHFESSFISLVQGLKLGDIFLEEKQSRDSLRADVDRFKRKLKSLLVEQNSVYEQLASSASLSDAARNFISEKLNLCIEEIEKVRSFISSKAAELDKLDNEIERYAENKNSLATILERVQSTGTSENFELRAQTSAAIRSVVADILVAPNGELEEA